MFAINWLRQRLGISVPVICLLAVPIAGAASVALAKGISAPLDAKVVELLKTRLPKTKVTSINCTKVEGLCEVTAGSNLFYVDSKARFLVIGRVYDMETRQDITAARLLEMNPDMLVGGAAKANALAATGDNPEDTNIVREEAGKARTVPTPAKLSLADLPKDGAIVWGNKSATREVTIFTDFRCGYCRALSAALTTMDIRVIERPISVLGTRDLSNQVYCAKNREAAVHAAYAGEALKSEGNCDTSGLDANEAFARKNGLGGTPVIVRSDGVIQQGFFNKASLEKFLDGARS